MSYSAANVSVLAAIAREVGADVLERETIVCGICGFALNEVRECPRCKMIAEMEAQELVQAVEEFLGLTHDDGEEARDG